MTPKKQIIKITLHFNGFFMVFSVSFYAYFVSPPGWSVWQNKKYLFIHKFKTFILYIMFELSVIPIFVIYCPLFI